MWSSYSTAMSIVCSNFTYTKWCLGNSVESNCLNPSAFSEVFNISVDDSYKLVQDYRYLNFLCTYGVQCE